MKETLEKLKVVLKELENKYGSILLFAFFLREGAFGKWDLLISASWLDPRFLESYERIAQFLQGTGEGDKIQVSRIVLLNVNDPAVAFLQDSYTVPNGSFIEVQNSESLSDWFGFTIRRAFILRCVDSEVNISLPE